MMSFEIISKELNRFSIRYTPLCPRFRSGQRPPQMINLAPPHRVGSTPRSPTADRTGSTPRPPTTDRAGHRLERVPKSVGSTWLSTGSSAPFWP